MHCPVRLSVALLSVSLLVACINEKHEERTALVDLAHIESKEDLNKMLQSSKPMVWQTIRDSNLEYANTSPSSKTEYDVLPLKYSINEAGQGIIWLRELQVKPNGKQLDALQSVFDPPYQWIEHYCTQPTRKIMREYGYSVREKLITKNAELVYDHLINEATCAEFEKLVSYIENE